MADARTVPENVVEQPLAAIGGPPVVQNAAKYADLFRWPVVTLDDERAVLEVLRAGAMSDTAVTERFEQEWAAYVGTRYALGHCNGTMALLAAMWAAGLGRGDELICPSITYWASAMPALSLGATVVFADVDPYTLCIDPADIERRIGPGTRAIMVVHYGAHPADMDPIMAVARRRGLKVIEDAAHSHGSLYKGRMAGSIGDVAAFSMMSRKSFPAGEAGMLTTNDAEIYERAIAFAHYERHEAALTRPELKALAGVPLGGVKGRMNQLASALGRSQLARYPERMAEIDRAMMLLCDFLDGVPGIRPRRTARGTGSTMGGWYLPSAIYDAEALAGLPQEKFRKALAAEGVAIGVGVNVPLHLHPAFNDADIYRDGRPTRIAFSDRDVRQPRGSLPVAEAAADRVIALPWFKKFDSAAIELFAAAYRKVARHATRLVKGA